MSSATWRSRSSSVTELDTAVPICARTRSETTEEREVLPVIVCLLEQQALCAFSPPRGTGPARIQTLAQAAQPPIGLTTISPLLSLCHGSETPHQPKGHSQDKFFSGSGNPCHIGIFFQLNSGWSHVYSVRHNPRSPASLMPHLLWSVVVVFLHHTFFCWEQCNPLYTNFRVIQFR